MTDRSIPNDSKRKVFVSGGAGFIGRAVCEFLATAGFNVHTLTREVDPDLERVGVDVKRGDLWDTSLLEVALTGSDVIIHCAGNAKFGNGPQYEHENVALTNHILSCAQRHAGKARFIFISTIGAVDRGRSDSCQFPLTEDSQTFPTSDYGRSKLRAEELVSRSGLPYVIIRPSMVVGADMRLTSHFSVFARKALRKNLISRLNWPGRFSVVHVKDLAAAIYEVAVNPMAIGKKYFCSGGIISIGGFFNFCRPEVARLPLFFVSWIASLIPGLVPFRLKAMLLPALTAADDRLRALGWSPQYSAESALIEVIERERARLDPTISPGGQTVITGAASGLGRALAIYLGPMRDRLLLIDKNEDALNELSLMLPNGTVAVVDLASDCEIQSLLASSQWLNYNITELFACAGVGLRGEMQKISLENHRNTFAINVFARIALAKDVIEKMKRKHFGRIVLISSSSAFQPLPYMATYAASNSALLLIGEAWGAEVREEGIEIMTVCPGGMRTNFQKNSGVKEIPGEKLLLPEKVAEEIILGLQRARAVIIVSFRSLAMSMLARFAPRSWQTKLWSYLMGRLR